MLRAIVSRDRDAAIAIAEWSDGALSAMCTSPFGRASRGGVCLCRRVRGRLRRDVRRSPSQVSIEAMCDCTVWRADDDRLEAFYRADPACERLARRLAERLTCELYERMLQLYACTPQERYETLLRRCPELLNIVALKELASYLRVRPETLQSHSRPRAVRN